jgi:hypothetical protein
MVVMPTGLKSILRNRASDSDTNRNIGMIVAIVVVAVRSDKPPMRHRDHARLKWSESSKRTLRYSSGSALLKGLVNADIKEVTGYLHHTGLQRRVIRKEGQLLFCSIPAVSSRCGSNQRQVAQFRSTR